MGDQTTNLSPLPERPTAAPSGEGATSGQHSSSGQHSLTPTDQHSAGTSEVSHDTSNQEDQSISIQPPTSPGGHMPMVANRPTLLNSDVASAAPTTPTITPMSSSIKDTVQTNGHAFTASSDSNELPTPTLGAFITNAQRWPALFQKSKKKLTLEMIGKSDLVSYCTLIQTSTLTKKISPVGLQH